MPDWIALSDRPDLNGIHAGAPSLDRGLFVLELALPLLKPTLLLQVQTDPQRSFAVFFDPEAEISLLNRQGDILRRHRLAGPIKQQQGTGRITFQFDLPAGRWTLGHEMPEHGQRQVTHGVQCLPLYLDDIRQLCADGAGCLRHPSVLWFGMTAQPDLPVRAGWVGLNTPIDTRRGPVRASLLRPGDMIATVEDGFQPLLGLARRSFPGRGSFAPVILRSPFFGLTTDLLVSADQLVMIAGASVEYLFGVEEALIAAGHLCDGLVALRDNRRAVTDAVRLDMGRPLTITSDGCCLMSAHDPQDPLPCRALLPYEALPLLPLLGRTALRRVA